MQIAATDGARVEIPLHSRKTPSLTPAVREEANGSIGVGIYVYAGGA